MFINYEFSYYFRLCVRSCLSTVNYTITSGYVWIKLQGEWYITTNIPNTKLLLFDSKCSRIWRVSFKSFSILVFVQQDFAPRLFTFEVKLMKVPINIIMGQFERGVLLFSDRNPLPILLFSCQAAFSEKNTGFNFTYSNLLVTFSSHD